MPATTEPRGLAARAAWPGRGAGGRRRGLAGLVQAPQVPPVWRAPEGPAAVPVGGGGAWPGFETTRRAKLAARTARGRAAAQRHTQWPGPTAPGTPAARQATKTPEPEAVPGFGGGGWGIRTPEGLHPTRFPSVRHRPLGESSVHIVPDNHKRQKALGANPGQWSRSQHGTTPLEESREANQIEDHGAEDQDAVEDEGCDGFARTDAAG